MEHAAFTVLQPQRGLRMSIIEVISALTEFAGPLPTLAFVVLLGLVLFARSDTPTKRAAWLLDAARKPSPVDREVVEQRDLDRAETGTRDAEQGRSAHSGS